MSSLRIAFFASGEFALPTLERLVEIDRDETGVSLAAVVTRPDRPAGRGRKARRTPVREAGERLGIDVLAPETVNDREFLESLGETGPIELFLVADYGEFLRKTFREFPAIGAFNLHGSLLPRHRGAAPVAYAILSGDKRTGVTLFRIERELDSGPIVAMASTGIVDETTGELEARLARLAADVLESALPDFVDGSFTESPQDERAVTLAPKLSKSQGEIDWGRPAVEVARLVRAMHPWPIACSTLDGSGPLRILRARVSGAEGAISRPGTVVAVARDRITVACGEGALEILELQRPGKAALAAEAFLRGRALAKGERFV